METFILRENIRRFAEMLALERAPERRAVIQRLLAEEEAKLAALTGGASPHRKTE